MFKWLKKKTFSAGPLLRSVPLLYMLVVASLINQVSYALLGDLTTPALFVLVALITSSFSKNMIVILTFALAFSNIIKYGGSKMRVSEGMSKLEQGKVDEGPKPDKKKTKEDPEPDTAPSALDPATVKEAKTKLAELKGIQKSLLSAMGDIDTHLQNADAAMESLNEGFRAGAKKTK
jgi:hypothetical protein